MEGQRQRLRNVSAQGALTVGLGVVLLVSLAVRNGLPIPPTPALAPVIVDVDGASIGSEISDGGPFWTIDLPGATIRVGNTTASSITAVLRFLVVDGPCGRGGTIILEGAGPAREIELEPGSAIDVEAPDLAVGALSAITVTLTPDGPACPPFGGDPRSIHFQLFAVDAAAG